MSVFSGQLREAGYETLFLLGGFLALSVEPTHRNFNRILRWIDESHSRRELLRGLEQRGLVASVESGGKWVPRLTERGRVAFSGGRDPEEWWGRSWDGAWRLLTFDLPRREGAARMKLRRWLSANYFGRMQGSVWISPDPMDGIAGGISGEGVDLSMVMMFEGGVVGGPMPREVASLAWNFGKINKAYRCYAGMTKRVLRQVAKENPSEARLRRILAEDRKLWWEAVRGDPLLPAALHPIGYEGTGAWELRGRLLRKLGQGIDAIR